MRRWIKKSQRSGNEREKKHNTFIPLLCCRAENRTGSDGGGGVGKGGVGGICWWLSEEKRESRPGMSVASQLDVDGGWKHCALYFGLFWAKFWKSSPNSPALLIPPPHVHVPLICPHLPTSVYVFNVCTVRGRRTWLPGSKYLDYDPVWLFIQSLTVCGAPMQPWHSHHVGTSWPDVELKSEDIRCALFHCIELLSHVSPSPLHPQLKNNTANWSKQLACFIVLNLLPRMSINSILKLFQLKRQFLTPKIQVMFLGFFWIAGCLINMLPLQCSA